MASVEDFVEYLTARSGAPLSILVGCERVDCPIELVCALVVARGASVDDILSLLHESVSMEELEAALRIVQIAGKTTGTANPEDGLDAARIMKDPKYALQIQEVLSGVPKRVVSELIASAGEIFFALTMNAVGCRVVQKLIEVAPLEDALRVVHPDLTFRVIECSLDVNGNHVIQKIIDLFPSAECRFIVDAILADPSSVRRLSLHCYGCRVIQRLMSRCSVGEVSEILESLCSDPATISALSNDVFGNYVMQHAIEFGRDIDRERITICLASLNLVELGCSKFASNVVEKAIRACNKSPGAGFTLSANTVIVTRLLLNSLLVESSDRGILTLMKDRYGNYVVRAVIELTRPEFREEVSRIKAIIIENANVLKKYTFGWHLVERLDKMATRNQTIPPYV